jgi:hypothetical protein
MSYEFTFGAHRHTMKNPLLCGISPHGLGAPVGRVTLRDAWRIAILLPLRLGLQNYELLTSRRCWLS